MESTSLLKFCRFEICCPGASQELLLHEILELGFHVAKTKDTNTFSCEKKNPTDDVINKLLHVVKTIKGPKESEDDSFPSFEIIHKMPEGNEIKENWHRREPEGVEEDADGKIKFLAEELDSCTNVSETKEKLEMDMNEIDDREESRSSRLCDHSKGERASNDNHSTQTEKLQTMKNSLSSASEDKKGDHEVTSTSDEYHDHNGDEKPMSMCHLSMDRTDDLRKSQTQCEVDSKQNYLSEEHTVVVPLIKKYRAEEYDEENGKEELKLEKERGECMMKSTFEGTGDGGQADGKNMDNVQHFSEEIHSNKNDELKAENMVSISDTEFDKNRNAKRNVVTDHAGEENSKQQKSDVKVICGDMETHFNEISGKCQCITQDIDPTSVASFARKGSFEEADKETRLEHPTKSSKSEKEDCHRVYDDDKQEGREIKKEESKSQKEKDSLKSDAEVTDDDDKEEEDDDEEKQEYEEEKANFSIILFEKGGYEIALNWFANTKSIEYLRKPQIQNTLMTVKVNDQQCIDELKDFQEKLKQEKLATNQYGLLREVKKHWGPLIVAEHFSEHILLTAPKEIHAKIRNEFPDLYETETTHQLSASNISKEEATYKKGMGANREEKERLTASAQWMPEDGFDSDDDDHYASVDDEKPKDESFSNIPFEKGGYELALTFFANSKSLEYLRKPEITNSWIVVKVKDQQCTKELINFKNKLKKAKITTDKHELLRRVKKRWESQIVTEHFGDHILLTAPKEIHAQIRNECPDLYETETTHQLSASNISKEEATYKKGMGANREEKERLTASAPPMPKDGFEGHHSKLTVKIEKTNITCLHVDVIVNAASYRLKNTGGVAKVIAEAAGKKMIEECENFISKKIKVDATHHFASSGGGKLFAKEVYHAVGPKFSFYTNRKDDCKRDLRLTILRCLCHAEVQGYRSIAFPSISAAVFGVPREICVESYMKAVQHFEVIRKRHSVEKLEEVYFVDIDDSMVKAIKQHFVENWDCPISASDRELRSDKIDMEIYFARNRSGGRDGNATRAGLSSHGVHSSGVGAKPKSSWRPSHGPQAPPGYYDVITSSKNDPSAHGPRPPPRYDDITISVSKNDPAHSSAHGPQPPPSYDDITIPVSKNDPAHSSAHGSVTQSSPSDKTSSNKESLYPSPHGPRSLPSYDDITISVSKNDPAHSSVHGSVTQSSPSDKTSSNKESLYPSQKLIGNMPSGLMDVRVKKDHRHREYFEIVYRFQHTTPNYPAANIPNDGDGHEVLYLLMLAFCRRLTLTRDTSTTSRIRWNFIHESASTYYNLYDPRYFQQLLSELKKKHVYHENMTSDERWRIDYYRKELVEHGNVILPSK